MTNDELRIGFFKMLVRETLSVFPVFIGYFICRGLGIFDKFYSCVKNSEFAKLSNSAKKGD